MTVDAGLWSTWQNPSNPLDVDDDGEIIPLDVLVLINDINARKARLLPVPPVPPTEPPPYLDVNGNGDISPQDVLIVVNYLNALSSGGAGEGEAVWFALAEASSPATSASDASPTRQRGETDSATLRRLDRSTRTYADASRPSGLSIRLQPKVDRPLDTDGPEGAVDFAAGSGGVIPGV
jgi:hypothetical protein